MSAQKEKLLRLGLPEAQRTRSRGFECDVDLLTECGFFSRNFQALRSRRGAATASGCSSNSSA